MANRWDDVEDGELATPASINDRLNTLRKGDLHNVRAYGALGNGSSDDTAAIEDAIEACPEGGVVWIPRASSHYVVNNSAGLDAAVLVDKSITILIDGEVRATFGAIQANPPTIFYVTAADVTLEGGGKLRGDGTKNDVNTGTDSTMPSLVRVTGNNFTMSGITVDTPPKVGVHLVSCSGAKITNCKFTGGPTSYSDTAYFAIRGGQGERHIIANNIFVPDANGGMFVSCIFFNNTNYCVVDGNIAYRPYEKLIYCAGSYNVINANSVLGNSGVIAGTSQAGTVGPVFRLDGIFNKLTNNFSRYGGGAQSLGGQGSDISGNTFIDAGQSAITVTAGTVALSYVNITNNICTCGNLTGISETSGIYVEPVTGVGTSSYIRICGNTVIGWSQSAPHAQIRIAAPGASSEVTRSVIADNNVAEGVRGIATEYMINSYVHGNRIHATELGIIETNGGTNRYELNPVEGASSPSVSGLAATSISDTPTEWTPVISDGTNNATMGGSGSNLGTYRRMGDRVQVSANVASTSLGSVSGAIRITGLPVACATGIKNRAAISVGATGGLNITAGQSVSGYIDGGTAYITLHLGDATTGTTAMQASEWSDDGNMVFSLEYNV